MFLLNKECKNSKQMNVYIDYLKQNANKWISKGIMFVFIDPTLCSY